MRVRDAAAADACEIVSLIREGFSPERREAFIYGSAGAEHYVAGQIAHAPVVDTRYFLAEDGGQLLGAIEMRDLGATLFLNYVAVAPAARRLGTGRELLRHAIRVMARSHEQLQLDVFEDNAPACAWYRGLGMVELSSTHWYRRALDATEVPPGRVAGLPHAEAALAMLGFAQINVTTPLRTYPVGMLGRRYFRLMDARGVADDALLATLCAVDRSRDLLLLCADEHVPGAQPFARTVRMSGDLRTLLPRLENR